MKIDNYQCHNDDQVSDGQWKKMEPRSSDAILEFLALKTEKSSFRAFRKTENSEKTVKVILNNVSFQSFVNFNNFMDFLDHLRKFNLVKQYSCRSYY